MKIFFRLAVILTAMVFVACTSDDSGQTDAVPSDTTSGADQVSPDTTGGPHPFDGFKHGDTEITENACPEGLSKLAGSWNFVGETKAADYEEVITITTNNFINNIKGNDEGTFKEGTVTGYYFCWDNQTRIVFVLESVQPEDLFGNKSGDAYPCDILTESMIPEAPPSMLMMCYFDWNVSGTWMDFQYAKVEACAAGTKACLPGENVIQCNEAGTMWTHVEYCPDGQQCDGGQCQ